MPEQSAITLLACLLALWVVHLKGQAAYYRGKFEEINNSEGWSEEARWWRRFWREWSEMQKDEDDA